jgi:hypothetical protein
MADKKISQLTALSAANLAPSTDVLAIVDTSATETKKIVAQDLVNGVLNVASSVGIGTASPGAKLHVLGSNLVGIFAGTNANTVYTEYRYNSTTTSGFIGNGSSILSAAADSDFIVRSEGALKFATNGNNFRAVIDTSGNLGLGVTPSAWSSGGNITLADNKAIGAAGQYLNLSANWYYSGGDKYVGNGYATLYYQQAGAHKWYIAPNNTSGAGATLPWTTAMTLDASGRLGVGVTSPDSMVEVNSSTAAYARFKVNYNGSALTYLGSFSGIVGSGNATDTMLASTGVLAFGAGGTTERARITSGGYSKFSNDGTYNGSTQAYHEFRQTATDANIVVNTNTAASPYGYEIKFTAASPDNNTNYFFYCSDSTTARCIIWSDGDLANHDGVYGTISDERLKQDIVDASSQWNDVKAIRFRKYRMKTDVEANPNAPAMLGVVAQELEQTSPGLIDEHSNEDGTTTKTVKSSILLMKAAVALQEAMTRIEQLEAKVAALEAK